jgi:N-carbamoylputrescine amidase
MQIAGFQNGYFVALCNRVGNEERIAFEGNSFITAPDGRLVARAPKGKDHILITEIDLAEVKKSHARKHFIQDRRPELYRQWDGGRVS